MADVEEVDDAKNIDEPEVDEQDAEDIEDIDEPGVEAHDLIKGVDDIIGVKKDSKRKENPEEIEETLIYEIQPEKEENNQNTQSQNQSQTQAQQKQLHLNQFDEGVVEEDIFHVVVQKNKFKALFDSIPEVAVIHDGKKLLNANRSFEKISGYKKEEVIGKALNKVMKGNKLIKKDGSLVEMLLEQTDAEENFLLLMSDIGSLKEMEKCYALFNILSDHLQDAVLQIDLKGNIVYSNRAACNFFGYSDVEISDKTLKDLVKHKSKISNLIKKVISGDIVKGEVECLGKQGNFLAEMTLHNLNNGTEVLCIIRDISEEKELKNQIAKAREKYEQLVNNVNDIIFSIDTQGNINYVNYQFEKQLGYKVDQIKSIISLIHPNDVQKVVTALAESKKGFKDLEFLVQNSKKKWEYFSLNAAPMKEWSKIIGFIGTMRNIDEKKRAEDKTEQKRKELEEQNKKLRTQEELKSKFVSNVSHDLRTPLTSIQGYSELLSSKVLGELNKEQIEASSVIHNEALRLGKLINDLLDASRIDAGAMVLHKKPFFISSLEEKCACRPLAYSKGLTVIWNTPDSIGEVYADPDRINQVLMNLVSNAIKYTERGSITVNSFKKDKKFIQIDVIDTGEGIQKRELDKIFERFYRVKDKGAKKEGTGLGLSIAKDIIELHEGELKVESVVSKGSKFSFTLPRFSAIKKEELKVEDMIDQDQNLLERSDTGYENKVIEAVETEINTKDKDILDVSSSSNSK